MKEEVQTVSVVAGKENPGTVGLEENIVDFGEKTVVFGASTVDFEGSTVGFAERIAVVESTAAVLEMMGSLVEIRKPVAREAPVRGPSGYSVAEFSVIEELGGKEGIRD